MSSKKLSGKVAYDAEDRSAELYVYLYDKSTDQRYSISWNLTLNLKDLQEILSRLEEDLLEDTKVEDWIPFGDGELYHDKEEHLSYDVKGSLSLEIELNKPLFVKLLKAYEGLLKNRKTATVCI